MRLVANYASEVLLVLVIGSGKSLPFIYTTATLPPRLEKVLF